MKKKLITLGIVFTVILIFVFSVSPLTKYLILKYGPEYTGRKMSVEKVNLNPFMAKLTLKDFKIYEKNSKEVFFEIDNFMIDVSIIRMIFGKIKIEGIELNNPKLSIKKEGENYNFSDIIETIKHRGKKETKSKKKTFWSLEKFDLQNIDFGYTDSSMKDKFNIHIDKFEIPFLEVNEEIRADIYILSKNVLELKSKITIIDEFVSIDLQKIDINFHSFFPFIEKYANVSAFEGSFVGQNYITLDLKKKTVILQGDNELKNISIVNLEKKELVALKSLSINSFKVSTGKGEYHFDTVKIDSPKVKIEVDKDGINLVKLLKKSAEKKEKSAKKIIVNDYQLKQFSIEGMQVEFTDSRERKPFDYKFYNAFLKTSEIAKNKEGFTIEVGTNMNYDNATVNAKINVENNKYNSAVVELKTNAVKTNEFSHYIKNIINLSSVNGDISCDIIAKAKIDESKKLKLEAKGTASIDNFVIIDKKKSAQIARCKNFKVDIEKFMIPENIVVVNNIDINKMRLYGYNAKDGNTLSLMLGDKITFGKKKKEDIGKDKINIDFAYKIKKFSFKNGNVRLTDDTLENKFKYELDLKELSAVNLANDGKTNGKYKVKIFTNKEGKIDVGGNIVIGKNNEVAVEYDIQNFGLKDFKPLTEKYAPIIVNDGVMNYHGKIDIKDRQLSNENRVVIKNIDLKEKTNLFGIPIPLNAIISIIESKDGEVILDVPISGNMKNPKFDLTKTIIITIQNILIKVISAPFAFLNGSGGDSGGMDKLIFEYLSEGFSQKETEKIDKIADIMAKKPRLNFEFTQYTDSEKEYDKMLMDMIKLNYYKSSKEKKELVKEDYEEIGRISDFDILMIEYLNSKIPENKMDLDIYQKCEIALKEEEPKKKYEKILKSRNQFIADRLSAKGLQANRYKINLADFENIEAEDKVPHFTVKIMADESMVAVTSGQAITK